MSTPQVPPQAPPPQLASTATSKCPKCGTEITLTIPRPRIINTLDLTMIGFAHEKLDMCPNCQLNFLFTIQTIDVNGVLGMQWVPVAEKGKSNIQMPTQENMNTALKAHELAPKIKQ